MFQDAPIYHQLIAERGDVPARVRDAAADIRRRLEDVMRTGQPQAAFDQRHPSRDVGKHSPCRTVRIQSLLVAGWQSVRGFPARKDRVGGRIIDT